MVKNGKHFLGEKWKAFALRSGIRQGSPLSPVIFNSGFVFFFLKVLAMAIIEEKEMQGI